MYIRYAFIIALIFVARYDLNNISKHYMLR